MSCVFPNLQRFDIIVQNGGQLLGSLSYGVSGSSSPSQFSHECEPESQFSAQFSHKMRTVGSQCENRAENWVTW
jgi:hypothetical protein